MLGWRWAVDLLTNRPVMVERWTVFLFDVPRPILSVEVVRRVRRAVEAFTKRPVRALLLAVRAIGLASVLGRVAHLRALRMKRLESGS